MAKNRQEIKRNTRNIIAESTLNLIDVLIKHFLHDAKKTGHTSPKHTDVNDFAYWFYSPEPFAGMPKEPEIEEILREKSRKIKVFLADIAAKGKGDWDKEITQAGVTRQYKEMDADRKIGYFHNYYNKVKPTIKVDKIQDEYYYKMNEDTVNDMLSRKPGKWKVQNPTYRYEGEIPVKPGVFITDRFTIKYQISFTMDWLYMQKKGLIKGATLYFRKNSLEFDKAISDFVAGFHFNGNFNQAKSTLNIRLKNTYVVNKTWEIETVVEGNKISVEFEAKVCEATINDIHIIGKIGVQLSAELYPNPPGPNHPIPSSDFNWGKEWEKALTSTGFGLAGAILLAFVSRALQFVSGVFFFILEPIYNDPYNMDLPMAVKLDRAKKEKDEGEA